MNENLTFYYYLWTDAHFLKFVSSLILTECSLCPGFNLYGEETGKMLNDNVWTMVRMVKT